MTDELYQAALRKMELLIEEANVDTEFLDALKEKIAANEAVSGEEIDAATEEVMRLADLMVEQERAAEEKLRAETAAKAAKFQISINGTNGKITRAGLSPADQHMIQTLEGTHVTLPEFQRTHGLVPDGILGPKTQALIDDLAYKRKNNADLAKLVEDTAGRNKFAARLPKAKPCDARAFARDAMGTQHWRTCDKGPHDESEIPHGATFQDAGDEFRVRWRGAGDGFFQLARGGNWSQISEVTWRKDALHTFAAGGYNPVTRPKTFVQVRNDEIPAKIEEKYPALKEEPVPSTLYGAPMTREEYRTKFEEMQYSVVKSLYWGYRVIVSLAKGGTWALWSPSRATAERVGAKRLKRELTKLTLMFERDNPERIGAKALGVHFPMTTEEVTEMLAKSDSEERNRQQAEWDAEFHGDEKAS